MDRLAHGAALQAARLAAQATRLDIATRAGMTRARLRDIETGAPAPDRTLARVGAAVGCDGAPFVRGSCAALLRLAQGPGVLLSHARASMADLRLLLHQGLVYVDHGRVCAVHRNGDTTA